MVCFISLSALEKKIPAVSGKEECAGFSCGKGNMAVKVLSVQAFEKKKIMFYLLQVQNSRKGNVYFNRKKTVKRTLHLRLYRPQPAGESN